MNKLFIKLLLSCLLCGPQLLISQQTYELVRLGSNYGGWTIPTGILNQDSICYCAGAGEDISFDISLINTYGCNVYIFDPTPRAINHVEQVQTMLSQGETIFSNGPVPTLYKLDTSLVKNIHFLPIGLWNNNETLTFYLPKNPNHVSCSALNLQNTLDTFHAPCKNLSTIMQQYGHNHIDLLKMDIEGAEYQVIENMFQDQIFPRILCIEFHTTKQFNKETAIYSLEGNGYAILNSKNNKDYTFILQNK